MRKISCLLCLLFISVADAQDYLGFVNSNYAGITAAQINPANIADSRMRVDVSLLGLSFHTANNYVGLKRAALSYEGSLASAIRRAYKGDAGAFPAFKDSAFQKNYLTEVVNGNDKSIYSSARITLPSFMITLNNRNAIGLSINARSYIHVDGVGEQLARLVYSDVGRMQDFDVTELIGKDLRNKHLSANAMLWMEYGLTYAHVFRDKGKHFFKAGATPKLLQGLAAAYLNVRDLQFRFDNDAVQINNDSLQVLAVLKTNVNYGHSSNLEFPSPDAPNKQTNPFLNDPTFYNTLGGGIPKFAALPGFGLDLGAVYEWRPNYADYQVNMDGRKNVWKREKNKYKLKIGLSVLDIGSIKFPKGKLSSDFTIDIDTIHYRLIETNDYPVYDIDRLIDSLTEFRETPDHFSMSMPTSISMQIDYNIYKDLYVNFTPFIAFRHENKQGKAHEITVLSLTPRWDHKWFGVSVPVTYNSFYARANQPIIVGAMARLGPLVIGTNDIGSYTTGNFFGANFYMLLKVPIPYNRIRDRDNDGVSDKKDLCRFTPGVWEFRGCADSDSDHVQDKYDNCPDVPGLKELMGCPDKDGDGITDKEDACPDSAGTAEFKGCPDRDGDGVIDRNDACPDLAGLTEFNGCPDTDADGTPDGDDACPDIFGPKEYKGCPDKDGDQVLDKEDECPEIQGPAENKGCPWPDTDGDGIYDKDDSCATVAGVQLYKGCPPPPPQMKAAEKKIIERAFASLEFASARDVIKSKSFSSLNALATIMKQHTEDWRLKLSGHTDNSGDPEKNMILSEKRANAVKNYLVKRGVDPEQITTEWFGQDKPIADNKTARGRQKNRRVEMTIISRE